MRQRTREDVEGDAVKAAYDVHPETLLKLRMMERIPVADERDAEQMAGLLGSLPLSLQDKTRLPGRQ